MCHAVFALRELGYETIMVNCNPETVSTDYDTSDRLYFEPLTIEDVLNILDAEKPEGVIVQFGGQTPLKLAVPLEREGIRILGTSPDSIDRAEDRKRFKELLHKLNLRQPESETAMSVEDAVAAAEQDRISRHGQALVCPGRQGDGDRIRRRFHPKLYGKGREGVSRPPHSCR